jgi:hypothetical protein
MELLKPTSVNSTADYKAGDKTSLTRDDLTGASGSQESVTKVKELDSSNVALSKPNVEKLLADQLLLDAGGKSNFTISSYKETKPPIPDEPFYIQQQYVNNVDGNIEQLKSNEGTEDLFNKVQHALQYSEAAHLTIADIFSSLGQLDNDTESYLVASQSYIENNLKNKLPAASAENKFAQGSSLFDLPGAGFIGVTFEVETQEGDIITVTYQRNSSYGNEEGFNGLSYQVDGELSEDEHEALNQLFAGTSEYIGQVLSNDQSVSGLDNIDIAESFDMSLLKGFSIDTNKFIDKSSFAYEVNQETQEQTLSVAMNYNTMGSSQNFGFSLTTSLLGEKDDEELSRYALEMRDLLDEFGFRNKGKEVLNEFIVESFTSLFDVNTQKSQHDIDKFVIPTIGKRVGANQFTSKISSLMDYSYSLGISESKGKDDGVSTRIKMSQVTESKELENLYEYSQKKSFSLDSRSSTPSSLASVDKDIVITTRKEELENKITWDSSNDALNLTSSHTLDNRIEDTRMYSDGRVKTLVTEEAIVELSELKLIEDILSNMYTSTREIKKETIEKEERDGAARVTEKSKAIDVYMQYDALKLS